MQIQLISLSLCDNLYLFKMCLQLFQGVCITCMHHPHLLLLIISLALHILGLRLHLWECICTFQNPQIYRVYWLSKLNITSGLPNSNAWKVNYLQEWMVSNLCALHFCLVFSVDNLCRDIYLRSNMDDQGFVPVSIIAKFNRVRSLSCTITFFTPTEEDWLS